MGLAEGLWRGLVTIAREGMQMSRHAALLALAVGIVTLSGCYENATGVKQYEPGVYKGESDPLVYKQKAGSLEGELSQRAGEAYWDR